MVMIIYSIISQGFRKSLLLMGQRNSTLISNTMSTSSLLHDVNVETKRATFAMACFWAPDSLFGVHKGVIRTRVGYAGGTTSSPTYKRIGDHTESIDIDYDPKEVTYDELLDVFWKHHDPTAHTSKQYTSLIFYHDAEQKELAEKSMHYEEKTKTSYIVTKLLPAKEFYDAEDYHQKYRLQQHPWLMEAIGLKSGPMLKKSHLAARLNGYVVGLGGMKQFESEVSSFGLDEKTADYVRKQIVKFEGRGLFC